jgi:hypothetical protein
MAAAAASRAITARLALEIELEVTKVLGSVTGCIL